jgi:hypothetical protein
LVCDGAQGGVLGVGRKILHPAGRFCVQGEIAHDQAPAVLVGVLEDNVF